MFRTALSDGGWAVAVGAVILAFVVSWLAFNPVEEAGNAIIDVARSPESVRCLEGWTTTTGKITEDGATRVNLKVCTSPDQKTVITVRENQAPVGFSDGRFLTAEETANFLR